MGRTVTLNRDGSATVKRTLHITPYSDAKAICELLVSGVRYAGGTILRGFPAQDPAFPYCFADSAEITGIGVYGTTSPSGTTILDYANTYAEGALVVLTYKTLDANETGDSPSNSGGDGSPSNEQQEIELATENWDFGGQNLTLPGRFYQFQNLHAQFPNANPKTLYAQNMNVVKTFPRVEFSLTRNRVPFFPSNTILQLVGRINRNAFTTRKLHFPAETMRFDGCNVSRKLSLGGVNYYQIQYKFAIQATWDRIHTDDLAGQEAEANTGQGFVASPGAVGWNRIYDPKTRYWRKVHEADGHTGQAATTRINNGESTPYHHAEEVFPTGLKKLFDPKAT